MAVAPVPIHSHHPVFEIVHEWAEYGHHLASGFKAIAAVHTYRRYGLLNVLQKTLPRNKAGNFRGMVISARWKTAFHYTSDVGEVLENVGLFASFATNLADAGHEFELVHHSNLEPTLKGMRYAALAGTAAERALAGMVTGSVHLAYRSMQGYCMMAGLLGGSAQSAANQCIVTLNHADAFVNRSVHMVTDTGNQAYAVYHPVEAAKKAYWWVVNMEFLPKR